MLRTRKAEPDPDVIKALSQMRLAQWVHLKDLKSGAILLDSQGREAYRVVGLTQLPGEIIGERGCLVETALCHFAGRILCDGIFIERGQLGPNLGAAATSAISASRLPAACIAIRPPLHSGNHHDPETE